MKITVKELHAQVVSRQSQIDDAGELLASTQFHRTEALLKEYLSELVAEHDELMKTTVETEILDKIVTRLSHLKQVNRDLGNDSFVGAFTDALDVIATERKAKDES